MASRERIGWWALGFLGAAVAAATTLRSIHLPAPPRAEPAPVPTSFDLPAIDAYIRGQLGPRNIVGASVALVRNGEIVFARGYGQRNRDTKAPVLETTPFAIGSVTKELTCAAMYLLAEEGKLAPTDSLAKYYPALTRATDITLDDLGAHVAGYRDFFPLDFADARMRKPIEPDDLLRKYAGGPLDFEPRTRWSYSNTGYVALGRIVERVSGVRFGDFLQTRIFAPSGMTHASFAPPPSADLATGYTSFAFSEPERAPREEEAWMHAAGAVYASATDLARWDLAFMNGQVLSSGSMKAMTTPRVLANGRSTEYGCGLQVRTEGGETVLSHGGEVSGFLAYNTFVPRLRAAVVVLVNSDQADGGGLQRELVKLVTKDESRVPKVSGPSAKEAATALVEELRAGKVDRARLGDAYGEYLSEHRLATAKEKLGAYGPLTKVTLLGQSERGGMEVSRLRFTFGEKSIGGVMFRAPDGRIEQLFFSRD
jgi:D-alanyl-D-alanine carboxypeptidase